MANASVTNLFSTVVHEALPGNAAVTNLFSTVVHSAQPGDASVTNLFSTVVHTVHPGDASIINLYSTVAHEGPEFLVPDITGTIGITASFDASIQGLGTSSTHYRWSWQSVPAGSSITNAILPLPDSGSTYPMNGNTGLWHFDSQDVATTRQGSVGLVDSWGDGWHGSNWVSVLVNSMVVIDSATLAAGAGPEWYNYTAEDGDLVEVIFSTLGCGGPHYGSECSYVLNSGSDGSGVSFLTSGGCPVGSYSFTASGFLTSSTITTPETSDYFVAPLDGIVLGPILTGSSYVGENAYYFDGVDDAIALPPANIMNIAGGNSRTIAFWASASAWVDNDVFFSYGQTSNGEDFTFLQRTGPDLQLNLWGGDLRVSVGSSTGWNHYFIIYDASETTSYIYQNNDLLGSLDRAINTFPSGPVVIGDSASPYWAGGFFGGVIDEFAVWDRALNACERDVVYGFLQTASIDAASGSSLNLLEQFSFVPDVTGTYSIDLEITDNENCSSITGTVTALIAPPPPPPPSGTLNLYSNISEIAWIYKEVPSSGGSSTSSLPILPAGNGGPMISSDYTINSFKALSAERVRRVEQVPFRLARKDRLGVRKLAESSPPPPPIGDDIKFYSNVTEIAWVSGPYTPPVVLPAPAPPPAPAPAPAPPPVESESPSILFSSLEIVAEAERAPQQGEVEFHALEVLVEADRTPMQGEVEFHALEVLVEADRTPMQGEIEFHGLEVLIEADRTPMQGEIDFHGLEVLVEADRTPMQANLEFSGLEITVEAERVTPEVGFIVFSNLEIVAEAEKS